MIFWLEQSRGNARSKLIPSNYSSGRCVWDSRGETQGSRKPRTASPGGVDGVSLYIRVQSSFWQHRKTLRLRAIIGKDAFLLPLRLWNHAALNQPDGDFTDYSPEELALLLAYEGDAQAMLQALQKVGFMDGMKIHGWAEHNGYHSFYSERAKLAAQTRWKGKDKKGKERKRKDPSIPLSNACSNASSIEDKKEDSLNRVRSLFHKRSATPLDNSERIAWEKAKKVVAATSPEEWTLLEWVYQQTTGDASQYRRQDMATLLNNWNCEIDRARNWKDGGQAKQQQKFLSFDERKKRKEEIQNRLNIQAKAKRARDPNGALNFTEEEQVLRDRLYEEMEAL